MSSEGQRLQGVSLRNAIIKDELLKGTLGKFFILSFDLFDPSELM